MTTMRNVLPVALAPLESDVRPWGTWQVLDVAPGYKVKRLTVRPGHRLSLQRHTQRSEHWVVVSGEATCSVGPALQVAGVGERVDVPRGAPHRLANDGTSALVVIEVQIGDYLAEDDIVRISDDYGRLTGPWLRA